MVNAKLHMICGNCGCNDKWEHSVYIADGASDTTYVSIELLCENCWTRHTLEVHELIDDREVE